MTTDRALRRELRELRLVTKAITRCLGPDRVRRAVQDYRWNEEPSFYKAVRVSRGRDAIENHISDPGSEIVSLVDLTLLTREEIAGIEGVGPTTMAAVDAAMAEHGLSYSEPETVGAA